MKQFRGRDASLWQSAVDEVVAKETAGTSPAADLQTTPAPVRRPDSSRIEILHADAIAEIVDQCKDVPSVALPPPAGGVAETVKYCSTAAFKLAEAKVRALFTKDDTELKQLQESLAPFSSCDPKWAQVLEVYAQSKIDASLRNIPYIRYTSLADFVIDDGRLPDPAKVAIVGDWGTGQNGARKLLESIAAKKPDVVIHLGDVYYSGTENEVKNYFYAIWQQVLGLPEVAWGEAPADTKARPATFHLAGNHDMYAGGAPYYTVIKMLGQPASYFCLRNKHWQFIAIDTGLHDSDPILEGSETVLEDTEVAWVKDKVANAGGRKTVLLSHHQLFSRFDAIAGKPVNERLLAQLKDILPQVTVWLWGHEHNLVVYKKYLDVLGRCVGHGAFPMPVDGPQPTPFEDVPIEDVFLAKDAVGALFQHGYMLMTLTGSTATADYFQYDADNDRETVLYTERL